MFCSFIVKLYTECESICWKNASEEIQGPLLYRWTVKHWCQTVTSYTDPVSPKYQPVLTHTDPVPPNTSQYRPILTQCHRIYLNVPCNKFPRDNYSSLQRPSQQCPSRQLFRAKIIPPLLQWSFKKRTVLQMTKIKGTEEHRLLQMIIWMIWPPLCSSVPLQMVICKEDGPPDDQHFSAQTDQRFKMTHEYWLVRW